MVRPVEFPDGRSPPEAAVAVGNACAWRLVKPWAEPVRSGLVDEFISKRNNTLVFRFQSNSLQIIFITSCLTLSFGQLET
jgi:hypothetical protein